MEILIGITLFVVLCAAEKMVSDGARGGQVDDAKKMILHDDGCLFTHNQLVDIDHGRHLTLKQESEMDERIMAIIKDQLCVRDIYPDASLSDDLGADSLDFVELIICIEEEFDIEIKDDEADSVQTVRDVIDIVNKKLKGREEVSTMHNNKGFVEPASATFGFMLLAAMIVIFPAVVSGTGMTQQNGAAKLKQDRKLIWCQMQNKGKDYCKAQYPRM